MAKTGDFRISRQNYTELSVSNESFSEEINILKNDGKPHSAIYLNQII